MGKSASKNGATQKGGNTQRKRAGHGRDGRPKGGAAAVTPIAVRLDLPPETHRKLRAVAGAHGTYMSRYLLRIIEEHLERVTPEMLELLTKPGAPVLKTYGELAREILAGAPGPLTPPDIARAIARQGHRPGLDHESVARGVRHALRAGRFTRTEAGWTVGK